MYLDVGESVPEYLARAPAPNRIRIPNLVWLPSSAAINVATNAPLTALLTFYGLPTVGSLAAKRVALKSHLRAPY